jgi:hypothetical protein
MPNKTTADGRPVTADAQAGECSLIALRSSVAGHQSIEKDR